MIRLALRVRRDQAELVLAELLELAPSGVEEVDVSADVVEYAVYGAPGELPELPSFQAAAGRALVEVSTSEVADDWAERWRSFHKPLVLGDRLVVRPPWEEVPASPASRASPGGETSLGPVDIVIDPGRAFGTGAHATTRLCLELLLDQVPPPLAAAPGSGLSRGGAGTSPAVVDLGCGSGVLAIAAALMGWRPVLALDFDPLAVEATRENAVANGIGADIEVRRFDLRSEAVPAAPLVLANLLRPLLLTWCVAMVTAGPGTPSGAARPETVIAGGLLGSEVDEVSAAFGRAGFREAERRAFGGWAALRLRRIAADE
ncbi:MAG TPA: 50S ribosomal protein L11 methyltransferase [Actinospica sp.]|nr:50S ribosomal protein L11 methyltransferase [Actinospica sp.]